MRVSLLAASLALLSSGCGAASTPAAAPDGPRYAARVDAVVLRSLTVEQGELGDAQRGAVRREAVQAVAEAMDGLTPTQVEAVRIDIQIAELRVTSSTRARALMTVHTVGPPERTRAMLEGAATAPGATAEDGARASSGAIQSATRGLPAALEAVEAEL